MFLARFVWRSQVWFRPSAGRSFYEQIGFAAKVDDHLFGRGGPARYHNAMHETSSRGINQVGLCKISRRGGRSWTREATNEQARCLQQHTTPPAPVGCMNRSTRPNGACVGPDGMTERACGRCQEGSGEDNTEAVSSTTTQHLFTLLLFALSLCFPPSVSHTTVRPLPTSSSSSMPHVQHSPPAHVPGQAELNRPGSGCHSARAGKITQLPGSGRAGGRKRREGRAGMRETEASR
eukprot:3871226-Rhodomonas_salina.1